MCKIDHKADRGCLAKAVLLRSKPPSMTAHRRRPCPHRTNMARAGNALTRGIGCPRAVLRCWRPCAAHDLTYAASCMSTPTRCRFDAGTDRPASAYNPFHAFDRRIIRKNQERCTACSLGLVGQSSTERKHEDRNDGPRFGARTDRNFCSRAERSHEATEFARRSDRRRRRQHGNQHQSWSRQERHFGRRSSIDEQQR